MLVVGGTELEGACVPDDFLEPPLPALDCLSLVISWGSEK